MPGGGSPAAEKQHGIMPPQQLTFCGVLSVMLQLEDIGARVFFEKQLTSSDVSASGRVVVPKVSHFVTASNDVRSASAAAAYCTFVAWTRAQSAKSPCCLSIVPVCLSCVVVQAIAEQYLPRIDNPGGMELVVEDAAGDKYTLRFRCETWFNVCSLFMWAERAAAIHVI